MENTNIIFIVAFLLFVIVYFVYETVILKAKNQYLIRENRVLSQIYFHRICISKRRKNIDSYDFQIQNIEIILKEQLEIKL